MNFRPCIKGTWSQCTFAILPLTIIGGTGYLLRASIQHTRLPKHDSNDTKDLQIFQPTLNLQAQFPGLVILILTGLVAYGLNKTVKKMEQAYKLPCPDGASALARSTISTLVDTIWAQISRDAKLMELTYLLRDGAPGGVLGIGDIGRWFFQDPYHFFAGLRGAPREKLSDYVFLVVISGSYALNIFDVAWNILGLGCGHFNSEFWASLGIMVVYKVVMLSALRAIIIYWQQPLLSRQPITPASNRPFVYATYPIAGSTVSPLTVHIDVKPANTPALPVEVRGGVKTQQPGSPPLTLPGAIPLISLEWQSLVKRDEPPLRPVPSQTLNREIQRICTLDKFIGRDGKDHGKFILEQGQQYSAAIHYESRRKT